MTHMRRSYSHQTFNIRLTRDEIIRLAGVTRTDAEDMDGCGKGDEAEILHDRATELYIIADGCRS